MSDKKTYIVFKPIGSSPSGKTLRWSAHASLDPDTVLGHVYWYGPWRKYIFHPSNSIFDEGCMQEAVDFIKLQTQLHYIRLEGEKNAGPETVSTDEA